MSQWRSVIAEATNFDPADLTPDQLSVEIAEALHAKQKLETAVVSWTKNLTDRNGHQRLGYSSPTNFLVDRGRMSPGEAKHLVALGNARGRAPHAFAAWVDGRISTGQARPLFGAAEAVPDEYLEAEEQLIAIIEGLDVVDTAKAVEYWRQSVEGPGELDSHTPMIRRGVCMSETALGMYRLDGWLTATAGIALQAALDALTPPLRDGDTRNPRQRRHDALEDLCRDWLDNGVTPTVGGEKPHLILHTDLEALRGLAGGLHETRSGQILDVDTLRRIACDCSITRVVFGPEGDVIDVGRKTRVWTSAQRKAITARDRHCQGAGCRVRPQHCDIHHREHWADGGTTNVAQGVLLCRSCHTLEHAKDPYRRRRRRHRS